MLGVVRLHTVEASMSHSDTVSYHCRQCPVLLALLSA